MLGFTTFFTPTRKIFIAGLVTAMAAVWIYHNTIGNHGGLPLYPVHIDRSARGLLGHVSCTSLDGDVLVSGDVEASADSGVLKIGASVNLGSGGNAINYPGWYTYFDTNDPAYGTQGGGVLVFTVDVSSALVDGEASASNMPTNYCSVFVSQIFN